MKLGNRVFTDKKEAGAAIVEMCKEIKYARDPTFIGEYAGFRMAVRFDSFYYKYVMKLEGRHSYDFEIGTDPLGNITRINHAVESIPKELAEMQTKLETLERQLETAKEEATKPFAKEAELAEKLERLSALNALLNMDEKGDDAVDLDDEPQQDTSGQDVQKQEIEQDEKEQPEEPAADAPKPYLVENARHNSVAEGNPQGYKMVATLADKPEGRMSLKEKLNNMKARVNAGERPSPKKDRGKEESL